MTLFFLALKVVCGTFGSWIEEISTLFRVIYWAVLHLKKSLKTTAKEVMSHTVISIEANRSVKEALELMQKHKIRRLAVTNNRTLIGLVTERKLLAELVSQLY